MCMLVIAVSDHPTSFYAHVKLYHKTARNFHIICKHPGCQNHYHNFISFKRHWNKKHGSTVTQITPNIVNEGKLLILFFSYVTVITSNVFSHCMSSEQHGASSKSCIRS